MLDDFDGVGRQLGDQIRTARFSAYWTWVNRSRCDRGYRRFYVYWWQRPPSCSRPRCGRKTGNWGKCASSCEFSRSTLASSSHECLVDQKRSNIAGRSPTDFPIRGKISFTNHLDCSLLNYPDSYWITGKLDRRNRQPLLLSNCCFNSGTGGREALPVSLLGGSCDRVYPVRCRRCRLCICGYRTSCGAHGKIGRAH